MVWGKAKNKCSFPTLAWWQEQLQKVENDDLTTTPDGVPVTATSLRTWSSNMGRKVNTWVRNVIDKSVYPAVAHGSAIYPELAESWTLQRNC